MRRISDLEPTQRPRERLVASGVNALSDAELVAVLLRTGRKGQGALDAAHCLLAETGGVAELARLGYRQLTRRSGYGPAKAATLLAAIELGKRVAHAELRRLEVLDDPGKAGEFLIRRFRGERIEVFGFMSLDRRHRLLAYHELTRGTRDQSLVAPAELFRRALLDDAAGVLVFHNHPSEDPLPSADDVELTRRLVAAGEVIGIQVLDHLVVAGANCRSLRRSRPGTFAVA
jgi:DNA repair protein RadC